MFDLRESATNESAVSGSEPAEFDPSRILSSLTLRQRSVFLLMGEGRTCAEIGRTLHLARSTVTLHRRRLMQKLGVTAKTDLVRLAVLVQLELDGVTGDRRG